MDKEYNYRKEILELRKELQKSECINAMLEEKLQDVLRSKSWRCTQFVRNITSKFYKSSSKDSEEEPISVYCYDYHEEPSYVSTYQDNIDFSDFSPLVKTIAFYLPQFHQISENDKWWGKGFTEWTNVKKAKPLFDNHYMPREPHDDFGYYRLDSFDTLKKQVKLAKMHGIYGFAFYYYWFSGKRLLEKPLDLFLKHTEIDFPFVLCWANENWTRTWDGLENEVLMRQKYLKNDPEKFIDDIAKYMKDSRYIKVQGKPLLLVYNPSAIPDFERVCFQWRERARQSGIGEIEIWSKTFVPAADYTNTSFVDGEFDFAPSQFHLPQDQITGISNSANVLNYTKLVDHLRNVYAYHYPLKKFSYSITMGWDNSARRKRDYSILYHYSLESFYKWAVMVIQKMAFNDFSDTFLFVNAWNEWGEGTYLEPDKKYGYANINTLSKAICGIPLKAQVKVFHDIPVRKAKQNFKILIQVHAFYPDVLPEILDELKKVPYQYDLYLSTNEEEKKKEIIKILKNYGMRNYHVAVYPNHGRDILPMILQLKEVYSQYDYMLHLHTKRSMTTTFGNEWREHIFRNLLGSTEHVKTIFQEFHKDSELGLIYPLPFPKIFCSLVEARGAIANNGENMKVLFKRLGIPLSEIDYFLTFPTGSMFWGRVDAIKELFEVLNADDFEEENGQIDGTMAHAVERCFDALARKNGYKSLEVMHKSEE